MTAMTKQEHERDAGRIQAERQGRGRPTAARPSSRPPSATASRSRTFATRKACAPTATAAPAWSRSRASACWRLPAAASRPPGMEVTHRQRARPVARRRWCSSCCCPTCRRRATRSTSELDQWAAKLKVGKPRFAPRASASGRSLAPGDRGQSRFLHPVHALRARLPRGAGERRHRLRLPRRALEDRVRPRRSDGRVHLRRLRRVRAGLPDRRADAGAQRRAWSKPDKQVHSVCPYCGVGCQLTYHVKDNKILHVDGRDGPSNHKRLCVKGRYGFDYVHHKQRLTKPLIRKPGVPKSRASSRWTPTANSREYFREASWEEALDFAAGRAEADPRQGRDNGGKGALAGFGSAKGTNEEAYLFQKLVRTGFGTQQRRSLHAAVPRLQRRGADGRRRLGRGIEPGERRRAGGGGVPDRRQPDRRTIRSRRPGSRTPSRTAPS